MAADHRGGGGPALPLTRDQAVREMVELITERPVGSDEEAWGLLSTLTITEDAMRLFGWLGLSTLVALARRGCRKSAEALVDRALGQPDRPYREEVQSLDAQQTAARLFDLLRSMGVEERKAREIVAARAKPALALAEARDQ